MEWAGVALVLLALVLLLGLVVARARRARAEAPPVMPGVSEEDQAELDRAFAEAERAAGSNREALLGARLGDLTRRGVPLRAVRPAPGDRTARLVFGNGTVLIARAPGTTRLFDLVVQAHRGRVRLDSWATTDTGTMLRFSWPPHGSIELEVLGLDQQD